MNVLVIGGSLGFSIYILSKYKKLTDFIVFGFHLALGFGLFVKKDRQNWKYDLEDLKRPPPIEVY